MREIRQDPVTQLYYFVDDKPEPAAETISWGKDNPFKSSFFEHDCIAEFLIGNAVEFEYVPVPKPAIALAKPKVEGNAKRIKRKSLKARKAA